MNKRLRIFLVLLSLVLVAGGDLACVGTQGVQTAYRTDLGRAPTRDVLAESVVNSLRTYGFRTESLGPDYIETAWRERAPDVPAQRQEGLARVRDRAVVFVHERGTGYYLGRLRIEYEGLRADGQWAAQPIPPPVKESYDDMVRESRRQLEHYMPQ